MFIFNPDIFLLPNYRISPFKSDSIARNILISEEYKYIAVEYFNQRFGMDKWLLTANGREAISISMENLKLLKSDLTTILTPSQNLYISSCVTSNIENYTNWNRIKTKQTKAYFVNHEFGYLYPEMNKIIEEGLPLIEDCCTTFFSQNIDEKIGRYGKYSIYSFPKFFPIQLGGLLVSNNQLINNEIQFKSSLSLKESNYILKVIGFELSQLKEILQKRAYVFNYLKEKYAEIGMTLRFPENKNIVPSVLLLQNNGVITDLQKHKNFLFRNGIQNSVFYGEDSFFVPCHQNLEIMDADYIFGVTKQYLNI